MRRRRTPRGSECREFEFLLGFTGLMVAAYSTFVFGVFFFLRYYYPIYFVGMIFAGIAPRRTPSPTSRSAPCRYAGSHWRARVCTR
jgi:hypothetical protein